MKKRQDSKGKDTVLERTISDEELEKLCSLAGKSSPDKINVLKKYGLPVLEINMEKPVNENAKTIYEFINEFQKLEKHPKLTVFKTVLNGWNCHY